MVSRWVVDHFDPEWQLLEMSNLRCPSGTAASSSTSAKVFNLDNWDGSAACNAAPPSSARRDGLTPAWGGDQRLIATKDIHCHFAERVYFCSPSSKMKRWTSTEHIGRNLRSGISRILSTRRRQETINHHERATRNNKIPGTRNKEPTDIRKL